MKHVLITGGTDGIGKELARKLQAAQHKVTILGREEAKTKAAAGELGCAYVVADVSNAALVDATITKAEEANGPIDILVNNAGLWMSASLEDSDPAETARLIEVNVLGVIYYSRAVIAGMKQRGQGRIINVNSQAGLYAHANRTVYHASKWAVTGFTKALQEELKSTGISVSGFYPGAMNTGFFAKANDTKDRSYALDPQLAADALLYLCQLPMDVEVPELGIKSLNY
jgi:NADP-dependent 3-hydroxy acid dehydrogenase YdfG